jgi:hypothetical protein
MSQRRVPRVTMGRSRLEVMHYVLSFCVGHKHDPVSDGLYQSGHGFVSGFAEDRAQPGDLVLLGSAPVSKWMIGWLVDVGFGGGRRYLIESLEDGSRCWWTDVSISWLPRTELQACWRWTDRQWAFRDRWFRVCYHDKDADFHRPMPPVFGKGREVAIGVRTKFDEDGITASRTFPDWRKVTRKMMGDAFDECVREKNAK